MSFDLDAGDTLACATSMRIDRFEGTTCRTISLPLSARKGYECLRRRKSHSERKICRCPFEKYEGAGGDGVETHCRSLFG